nr:MAG TPA: hypothetical protein [Caudoviricetes sp.]
MGIVGKTYLLKFFRDFEEFRRFFKIFVIFRKIRVIYHNLLFWSGYLYEFQTAHNFICEVCVG